MRTVVLTLCALALLVPVARTAVAAPEAEGSVAPTRVRILAAPGHEAGLVGGKVSGSIVSGTTGVEALGEVKAAPAAGAWAEVPLAANDRVFRWLRYEAPPGSNGNVAEVEFYAGKLRLAGQGYGSL